MYCCYTQPEWTRGGKKGAIWDDHYIPSIFITGDPNDMETIVKKLTKEKKKKKANKKFPVTFTIIGPNEVQTFKVNKEGCTDLHTCCSFICIHMTGLPIWVAWWWQKA